MRLCLEITSGTDVKSCNELLMWLMSSCREEVELYKLPAETEDLPVKYSVIDTYVLENISLSRLTERDV